MSDEPFTAAHPFKTFVKRLSNSLASSTLQAIALSLATLYSHNSLALPAEAELDRYLLATQKYIQAQQYDKAHQYLTKAGGLDIPLPADYHFYLGQVLEYNGDHKKAKAQFKSYVSKTGREGEFYTIALEKITEIEELQASKDAVKKAFEPQNAINKVTLSKSSGSKNGSNIQESLKSLYASDSNQEALIKHINTLLKSHPYSGSALQKAHTKTGIYYTLSLGSSNEIIVTKQDRRKKPFLITTSKHTIYGKNPFIRYECDITQGSCNLYTPEGNGVWMKTAYDEQSADDIAQLLTSLIQQLQRSNNTLSPDA